MGLGLFKNSTWTIIPWKGPKLENFVCGNTPKIEGRKPWTFPLVSTPP
jgi:hypothetical protein